MKNKNGLILLICFFLIAACVAVAYFRTPRETWSKSENRSLVQFPAAADYAGDMDGYARALERFLSDQFPWRPQLVSAYTNFQMKTGRWYVRGVRVMRAADHPANPSAKTPDVSAGPASSSDAALAAPEDPASADPAPQTPAPEPYFIGTDYLFLDSDRVYSDWQQEYQDALTLLCAQSGIPVVDAVLPHKNFALAEGTDGLIPGEIDKGNLAFRMASDEAAGALPLDLCSLLLARYDIRERAQMYFKSDIHWNPLGAFRCSELLAEELAAHGIIEETSVLRTEDFVWEDLSETHVYEGDLGRRFELKELPKEFIPAYRVADTSGLSYYTGSEKTLTERDRVMLVGIGEETLSYENLSTPNQPYLRIENLQAAEPLHVLVLKDSYQCPMTDYLSALFSGVTVIDPRFENPKLSDIIRDDEIDLVILLYHQNNFLREFTAYVNDSYFVSR